MFLLLMAESATLVISCDSNLRGDRPGSAGRPPQIPGIEVAYATPANTVAGDYYDVFPRPAKPTKNRVVFAVADVAGKSIPRHAHATFQASLKKHFHRAGRPARTRRQYEQVRLLQQPGRIAFHHCISFGVRCRPP